MQVHFGVGSLHAEWSRAVVCIGTFDGVHIGHQAVISAAVERAAEQELPAVLVTFDRHPAAVLAPTKCPKSLAALSDNLEQFERLGVGIAIVLPFDAELSRMSAERFLTEILVDAVHASEIVVGHDFAMGNGREGTTEWLAQRIPTIVIPPFELNGLRVSSSVIREYISEGKMIEAINLLGRPFRLSGVVVGGQKLGRQLGFPTANLARSFDQVLPADGVYAARFTCARGTFKAALAVGLRPAVGGGARTIEAYLMDYPGDSLYGLSCEMDILQFLREERHFDSLDALIEQMGKDVEDARALL